VAGIGAAAPPSPPNVKAGREGGRAAVPLLLLMGVSKATFLPAPSPAVGTTPSVVVAAGTLPKL
jgi:hypothetical protein